MGFTGGDVKLISYNHPIFGSGTLYAKAGEDGTLNIGGYTSADDDANITGTGQMIDIITRKRGSFEILCVWDTVDIKELDTINDMAGSPVLGDWTVEHISGVVWGGKGKPVGDVIGSTGTSTFNLKLAFEGKINNL